MSTLASTSELSSLSQESEMKKLGISTSYELNRFHQVQFLAGNDIAIQEVKRNLEAYEREFLQDEPVGIPHDYYHINGELFSEYINHPLFNIKKQIDDRERDGATIRGFSTFEKMITESSGDNVAVWYSPAGKAGTEGIFKDIHFDSGRLYLGFVNGTSQSFHLDIKVNEESFPIKEFLDYINYVTNGSVSPEYLDANQTGYYYLESPINTKMKTRDFLSLFQNFVSAYEDKVVYISQRESKIPKPHTIENVYEEVTHFVNNHTTARFSQCKSEALHNKEVVLTRDELTAMYLERIVPYVVANNGQMTLYGCSTTSTINERDITGSSNDILSLLSPSGLFSSFSTASRLLENGSKLIPETEQKYTYKEKGSCQSCGRPHTEVGLLGPCLVCEGCTEADNERKRKERLMQELGMMGKML